MMWVYDGWDILSHHPVLDFFSMSRICFFGLMVLNGDFSWCLQVIFFGFGVSCNSHEGFPWPWGYPNKWFISGNIPI